MRDFLHSPVPEPLSVGRSIAGSGRSVPLRIRRKLVVVFLAVTLAGCGLHPFETPGRINASIEGDVPSVTESPEGVQIPVRIEVSYPSAYEYGDSSGIGSHLEVAATVGVTPTGVHAASVLSNDSVELPALPGGWGRLAVNDELVCEIADRVTCTADLVVVFRPIASGAGVEANLAEWHMTAYISDVSGLPPFLPVGTNIDLVKRD